MTRKPAPGRHRGTCRHCGTSFSSKKKDAAFCTLRCYVASGEARKNVEEANRERWGRRHRFKCKNCGAEKDVVPSKRSKKFCDKSCWRQWNAEKFDRWLANPEVIVLPQAYDEFLTKKKLPCLIRGCPWEGDHLGMHVSGAHGIPAAEFKRIAGFNAKTGLISASVVDEVRKRAENFGDEEARKASLERAWASPRRHSPKYRVRLEGREHHKKAALVYPERHVAAGAAATKKRRQTTLEKNCVICGRKFVVSGLQRQRTWCSPECDKKLMRKHNQAAWEREKEARARGEKPTPRKRTAHAPKEGGGPLCGKGTPDPAIAGEDHDVECVQCRKMLKRRERLGLPKKNMSVHAAGEGRPALCRPFPGNQRVFVADPESQYEDMREVTCRRCLKALRQAEERRNAKPLPLPEFICGECGEKFTGKSRQTTTAKWCPGCRPKMRAKAHREWCEKNKEDRSRKSKEWRDNNPELVQAAYERKKKRRREQSAARKRQKGKQ